jgi:hypothetical protein
MITGSLIYFDKTTHTLGDFLEYWFPIFIPVFNMFCLIVYLIIILIGYLKDIKIK